jgi:hypothetical protein
MPGRRKSPQQKKRESYLKDRRNAYGENSKSSRKNVPRKKRAAARVNRHAVNSVMTGVAGPLDEDAAEEMESRVRSQPEGGAAKSPDRPLGQHLIGRLRRRVRLKMHGGEVATTKIKKVRATTRRGNRSKGRRG